MQDARDDERSQQRADLIQGLMQTESPSSSHLDSCVREHGITRRSADRLPHALRNGEEGGQFPVTGQSQERYGNHVDAIPQQRNRPILSCLVSNEARD